MREFTMIGNLFMVARPLPGRISSQSEERGATRVAAIEPKQPFRVYRTGAIALVIGFFTAFHSLAEERGDRSDAAAPPGATSCEDLAYSIRVHVTNIQKMKGTIVAQLYDDSPEDFLENDIGLTSANVSSEGASLCFVGGGPGFYAVAVYHDRNENGKLDKNFIGIPKEPVGTSNNPKVRFGKPKYEAAKFEVLESGVDIVVKLRKPF